MMAVCINCGILLRSNLQLYEYWAIELSPELVLIAEEWCGREITNSDRLCHECVNLVTRETENRLQPRDRPFTRQLGHTCVCISCGISLGRRSGRRRHKLHERSVEMNYIAVQIFPRQVPDEAFSCHACWLRVHEKITNVPIKLENVALACNGPVEHALCETIPDQPSPQHVGIAATTAPPTSVTTPISETDSWTPGVNLSFEPGQDIILENYRRTANTSNRCFVPYCVNLERQRVPRYLKRVILKDHKLYVTSNARVCRNHAMIYNWEIRNEHEFASSFNSTQIESMLDLLSNAPTFDS